MCLWQSEGSAPNSQQMFERWQLMLYLGSYLYLMMMMGSQQSQQLGSRQGRALDNLRCCHQAATLLIIHPHMGTQWHVSFHPLMMFVFVTKWGNKGKRLELPNRPPEHNSVNVTYGRCSTNLGPPCLVNSIVSVVRFRLLKTFIMLFLSWDISNCKKWFFM